MFIGRTAEAWTALAAWATFLVAAGAAVAAAFQVRHARKMREDQGRPYVVVTLRLNAAWPNAVDLVVRNYGLTAARQVRLGMVPQAQRSDLGRGESAEDVWVPETFVLLAPGEEWSTLWDVMMHRYAFNERDAGSPLPETYQVNIEYRGTRRKERYSDSFALDWTPLMQRHSIEARGLHDIAKSLKEIERRVTKWTDVPGNLRVMIRDGDQKDAREREHAGEWRRHRVEPGDDESPDPN